MLPYSPEFLRFAVFSALDRAPDSQFVPESYDIPECTLSFVAQTYHNVSSRGNEFTVGNVTTYSLGNGRYQQSDNVSEFPDGHQDLDMIKFKVANTSASLKVKDYDFMVNMADFLNAIAFLGTEVFNSTKLGGRILRAPRGTSRGTENSAAQLRTIRSGTDTSGDNARMTAQALHNSDRTKVGANIAQRMTDSIRNGRNATRAEGTAFMQESYVHVRWSWLAFPAGLLLASAGVLVMCILYSKRRKIVLWKSSSLALLFHYLDGWAPQL
ncbi:MAG: hypothetical protein M1816_002934 [Peltula sp. TS41687]|nr:MAG: hypothetical protein M1816_002934 [Peltula sp. TS41687]